MGHSRRIGAAANPGRGLGHALGLIALSLGLATLAGCDGCDAGNAGGTCACTADEQCAEGYHCTGCVCQGDCGDATPCPEATPNCGPDGRCGAPCTDSAGCPHEAYPNCDPDTGLCLARCAGDLDCPPSAAACDVNTGLCFVAECLADTECDPPTTVCEGYACVPGCASHAECDAEERCDLQDPEHLYHCEARDCAVDGDCAPPATRCDTDGLAQADGGGYCLPGCAGARDCPDGYGCTDATGICEPRDYGDIGQPCSGGCHSGFCLVDEGDLCTGFCCEQTDCPAGWGCRAREDGVGTGHEASVCVPLPATQGSGRPGDSCALGTDCRSGECVASRCAETCCTVGDCIAGESCIPGGSLARCVETPTTGNDPLGALGCVTSGTPADCLSNLCFSYLINDSGCVTDGDCPASRPHCADYYSDGTTDCVKDLCTDLCCGREDCPDTGGDRYFCARSGYGIGDFSVCLIHPGTGTAPEGATCATGAECDSGFCSPAAQVCRRRCCDDAQCGSVAAPRCALEELPVYSTLRLVNVCQP